MAKIYRVIQMKLNHLVEENVHTTQRIWALSQWQTFITVLPTRWRHKSTGIDTEQNYVTWDRVYAELCIWGPTLLILIVPTAGPSSNHRLVNGPNLFECNHLVLVLLLVQCVLVARDAVQPGHRQSLHEYHVLPVTWQAPRPHDGIAAAAAHVDDASYSTREAATDTRQLRQLSIADSSQHRHRHYDTCQRTPHDSTHPALSNIGDAQLSVKCPYLNNYGSSYA